ncbi:MAG: CCA tRNA nucleotidyltransferase [Bdellovibrionales bacterium]|nr:CCA tRNA nucleotidyltransferase [Bdellovibrionales bacterium]
MSITSILSKKPEWEEIQATLKIFHQNKWEAVLAGGCVRDALLGKPPMDFDVAVSASPEEVLRLFPKAKDLWKHYGVIFLPLKEKGKILEITTFREDHSYGDGRRPQFVRYTSSAKEDAKRRDFTVNALFYDIKSNQVLDFVNGLKDLKSHLLKTVGEPEERFKEDYLRPLRALRFSHQLNFQIESKTQKAIPLFAGKLQTLSKERIYSELVKMFSRGSMGQAVKILKDYSFFKVLFPFENEPINSSEFFWKNSFSFYHEPAFAWTVFSLPYFYHSPEKWMGFLKDNLKAPQAIAKKSCNYMQGVKTLLSKQESSFVEKLKVFELGANQITELSQSFGKALLNQEVKRTLEQKQSEAAKAQEEELSQKLKKLFQEFQTRSQGHNKLPSPLVTGADLIKAGHTSGRHMGQMLKKAYNFQVEENISEKDTVLNWILKKSLK